MTPPTSQPPQRRKYSDRVRPHDAIELLNSLDPATRQLLAQLVGLHLLVEEIPPVSYDPALAAMALPLIRAELVLPEEAAMPDDYADDWGPVPRGLPAVGLSTRLIGLVLALLSGRQSDAAMFYRHYQQQDGSVRLFSPQGGVYF